MSSDYADNEHYRNSDTLPSPSLDIEAADSVEQYVRKIDRLTLERREEEFREDIRSGIRSLTELMRENRELRHRLEIEFYKRFDTAKANGHVVPR